jgi:hypothetical protein
MTTATILRLAALEIVSQSGRQTLTPMMALSGLIALAIHGRTLSCLRADSSLQQARGGLGEGGRGDKS